MTQENNRAPGFEERQIQISLQGKNVWADPELAPLLIALNDAGLITRSHCTGHHGDNPSWVVIRLESIVSVEVKTHGEYNEVLIAWIKANPVEEVEDES